MLFLCLQAVIWLWLLGELLESSYYISKWFFVSSFGIDNNRTADNYTQIIH